MPAQMKTSWSYCPPKWHLKNVSLAKSTKKYLVPLITLMMDRCSPMITSHRGCCVTWESSEVLKGCYRPNPHGRGLPSVAPLWWAFPRPSNQTGVKLGTVVETRARSNALVCFDDSGGLNKSADRRSSPGASRFQRGRIKWCWSLMLLPLDIKHVHEAEKGMKIFVQGLHPFTCVPSPSVFLSTAWR